MAATEASEYTITLRRGESRSIPLVYRPRNKTLPPYNITGKPVEMRIQPSGASEIVYSSAPEISVTDGPNGQITIAIPEATVSGYGFDNAKYAVLLDGQRLIFGMLRIKSLYES